MAFSHMPPDASGRNFAVLEPLWTRSDAASVWSHATGRVRSQLHRSGTSMYSTGLCCPTSSRFVADVRSLLLTPVCQASIGASGCFLPTSDPASGCPDCRATGPASGHPDCRATSVLSPLRACFFAILRMAWFLSSCLDFA